MLEGLDAIDWSKLEHAYGEASDVPELIRALTLSPLDDEEDESASLFGTIWHQGTVYSATVAAIPFLIALLEQRAAHDPAEVLNLLALCGTGNGYYEVHGYMDMFRDRRETPEFQATVAEELRVVRAVHQAVEAGVQVYIRYLDDDDPDVRYLAAEVLTICHAHAETIAVALIKRTDIERHLPAQVSVVERLVNCLAHLQARDIPRLETIPFDENTQQRFLTWMEDETFPAIGRVVAALALLKYGDKEAGLAFLNRLPDMPPIEIGNWLREIVTVLAERDVDQALNWLERMLSYGDPATVFDLPDELVGNVFCHYRVEAEPCIRMMMLLLKHENTDVREASAENFAAFAYLASQVLPLLKKALAQEESLAVRDVLKRTIKTVQRAKPPRKLAELLDCERYDAMSIEEILDDIEVMLNDDYGDHSLMDLIATIAGMGEDTLQDARTVPMLLQTLKDNDCWIRGWSARALATIAPREPELIPVLVEELQAQPTGLIAMDTLTMLARQGIDVSAALPKLRHLAESKRRQVLMTNYTDVVPEDDQLRQMAQQTINTITS